ncbi:ABC transporter ATP-binding protein [uncultured Ruthenibacterium sp.]|uniref:ABC transporter ATP-binding protein n=1 Tax=uncultured Ruthenibacterium sp. TaxID=1905347 RepID=UPI00349EF12A
MDGMIQVEHLTKDYGRGRGVFDVNFQVAPGEVFGFLGPNGAGKTTTIRHLMGFVRPDKGSVRIAGLDCFDKAQLVQKKVGYLPGELSLAENMTGEGFLRFVANMKHVRDGRKKELCDRFEVDGKNRIRKMSKGQKQKIGLVCAFLADPDVYLLDEPTSGLDPLMQSRFLELLEEEKKRGKTILLSSHLFEEIERVCDRTAVLRAGRIAAIEPLQALRSTQSRLFTLRFETEKAALLFSDGLSGASREGCVVTACVQGSVDSFLKRAACYPVADLQARSQTLEERFLHYYGGDGQ